MSERLAVVDLPVGGPGPIGIARGTYTEITEIVAPSSAVAGELVTVTIRIRNIWTDYVHVAAVGVYDSEERFIDWPDSWIPAGATYSFSGSFVMPARDITIHAYSYYQDAEGYWQYDDEAEKRVSLAAPPEVYAGTISGMVLEYDEARAYIPAYDIPQGKRGLVHIWGRNDTGEYQTLGIGWVVTAPDGRVVERHENDWAFGWVGAGQDREFIGGRFNFDKVGTYRIAIALYMNSASPVEVDRYEGTLCTVAAVAPPPEVWVKLATKTVEIRPTPVEWQKLASRVITVTPIPVEWVKLAERQVTITPEVVEVVWQKLATKTITITPEVEIPPEYQLIQDTIYPWSYTFQGDAEVCTFEFKLTPEQIPGTRWLGEKIVDNFVSELEKEGSRLLGLKVYEDTTPTLWTNYLVEVTATASPIAWMPIIIGVLAILFIVAIVFAIRAIDEVFFKRKALDEETKKTFSRETLTAMILDLSPETPPETLEAMEDQELRDLLNRLLAEVAPPISPWAILALVGGLGVVGVGAAVAFATAKPAE